MLRIRGRLDRQHSLGTQFISVVLVSDGHAAEVIQSHVGRHLRADSLSTHHAPYVVPRSTPCRTNIPIEPGGCTDCQVSATAATDTMAGHDDLPGPGMI